MQLVVNKPIGILTLEMVSSAEWLKNDRPYLKKAIARIQLKEWLYFSRVEFSTDEH